MICDECIFKLTGENDDHICGYDGKPCNKNTPCYFMTDLEQARQIVIQVYKTALKNKEFQKAMKKRGVKL